MVSRGPQADKPKNEKDVNNSHLKKKEKKKMGRHTPMQISV